MVRVGRGLKDHLVPTPCHEQEHLPLDQVAHIRKYKRGRTENLYSGTNSVDEK